MLENSRRMTAGTVVIELTTAAPVDLDAVPPALRQLQEAIRASYAALGGRPEVEFETIVVEQDLPARCTTVWLRIASDSDSQASGSHRTWEESSLRLLARGTLTMIGWLNASEPRLIDLQLALRVLACGEVLKSSAQPTTPKSAALIRAITAWQNAKNALPKGDRFRIVFEKGFAELDLTNNISDPASLMRTALVSNRAAEMIFVVELPDYSGTGFWQLRHGESQVRAMFEPSPKLNAFYRREIDIRPGDALRCSVDFETFYGEDFEVVGERLRVVEVLDILEAPTFTPPCASESEVQTSGETERGQNLSGDEVEGVNSRESWERSEAELT